MKKIGKADTTRAVILVNILAAFILYIVLGAAGGFAASSGPGAWINYYGRSLGGSFIGFFYGIVLSLCAAAMLLTIWSLGGGFLNLLFSKLCRPRDIEGKHRGTSRRTPQDIFIAALRNSHEVWLILPAIFFMTIVALAMGEANAFAPARLQDAILIGSEHAIFGNYVFAALAAISYPHWLAVFIIFSFKNMALILIIAGVILAYTARDRFHELLIAFCIGILAMVPFWLMVPALSPQDRYINNVYHLPMPAQITAVVARYHPQPEIEVFLQSVRTDKADLPALPTSTFPSAHVFWAAIAGYYLFRVRARRRLLGWIVLPFLAASTFGTVLLAQHYFVDIPAGLLIAAFAIFCASHGKSGAPREVVYP
jgi:hypothetical protein